MTKCGGRESGKGSTDEGHPEPRRVVSPMAAANLAACIHYWREGEPCPQCAAESRIRALEAEVERLKKRVIASESAYWQIVSRHEDDREPVEREGGT